MGEFKDTPGLDRLRGTADYNEMMLLILHGVINQSGIFDSDEACSDYDSVETIDDFRAFCKKWDILKKINTEKEIADAELKYIELEKTPFSDEEIDRGTDELLRISGTPEEDINQLREKRKLRRPKIQ